MAHTTLSSVSQALSDLPLPAWVDKFTAPLPHLRSHLGIVIGSNVLFNVTEVVSRRVAKVAMKEKWAKLSRKERQEWGSKCASQLHCLIILPLAWYTLDWPSLRHDPIFGYDKTVGKVLAVTCGFIWDLVDSIKHSTPGFVVHGLASLSVFLFSFRPCCAYFGPSFLLWEASTPFLNLRWFFSKLGLDKSYPTLAAANDLAFAGAFFLSRIVFGTYSSLIFFREMLSRRHDISPFLFAIYGVGNIALNGLNWFWFSKIAKKALGSSKRPKSKSA